MLAQLQEAFGSVTALIAVISMETLIPIAALMIIAWHGLHFGKHRLIALIIAFFVAWPVYQYLPSNILTIGGGSAFVHSLAFLIILILAYILLSRVIRANFPIGRLARWLEALLLSATALALFYLTAHHFVPITDVYTFVLPGVDALFGSETAIVWWVFGSLAVLGVTSRAQVIV